MPSESLGGGAPSAPVLTAEQVASLRKLWAGYPSVGQLCDSYEALRIKIAALRDTSALLAGQLRQSRATVTALRAERDAAFDAGWKNYRDATVRFLRNRAKRYLSSLTTGGASVASDLSDIADSFEAQTGFDGGRPPSPSAATAEQGKECRAVSAGGYLCTMRVGHSGVHIALGVSNNELDRWPSPSAATAEEQKP